MIEHGNAWPILLDDTPSAFPRTRLRDRGKEREEQRSPFDTRDHRQRPILPVIVRTRSPCRVYETRTTECSTAPVLRCLTNSLVRPSLLLPRTGNHSDNCANANASANRAKRGGVAGGSGGSQAQPRAGRAQVDNDKDAEGCNHSRPAAPLDVSSEEHAPELAPLTTTNPRNAVAVGAHHSKAAKKTVAAKTAVGVHKKSSKSADKTKTTLRAAIPPGVRPAKIAKRTSSQRKPIIPKMDEDARVAVGTLLEIAKLDADVEAWPKQELQHVREELELLARREKLLSDELKSYRQKCATLRDENTRMARVASKCLSMVARPCDAPGVAKM